MKDRELHSQLVSVGPEIEAASADYDTKAGAGNLYLIAAAESVGGVCPRPHCVPQLDC